MEIDLNTILTIAAAVVSLIGALGGVAKKWRTAVAAAQAAAKKIPQFMVLVDEAQDVLNVVIDPDTGEPIDLKRITKADLAKLFKELQEVVTAFKKLKDDC